MISSILWRAGFVALACVTFGLQWDREARKNPAIAPTVPEIARSTSQFRIAALALGADNPEAALAEAERLVRRRPLPAEHLRILAQAQAAMGKIEPASLTIQYAAQRGWRDPLAQETMLRLALDAGDKDEAARRYAALFLRRDTEDSLLEELGAPILAEPGGEGRKTLITIVGGGKRWHNQFLGRGARVLPADAFVEIIRGTMAQGAQYDCDRITQAAGAIQNRDEAAGAEITALVEGEC